MIVWIVVCIQRKLVNLIILLDDFGKLWVLIKMPNKNFISQIKKVWNN